MAGNSSLNKAAQAKQDEFYTQLSDIENELRHYKDHFKGKVVFCNCDDPYESNFFKYFAMNFNYLGLKKLITTCYVSSPVVYTQLSLFDDMSYSVSAPANSKKKPYKVEITKVDDENNDGAFDLEDIKHLLKNKKNVCSILKGDGDFRSDECVELLKEADIVVTNPPFSLLREYISQLMDYGKSFLIIGNQNVTHYQDVFPLVMNNKIWSGYNHVKEFVKPDGTTQKFGNIVWLTNLDINKRHEEIILYRKYTPEEYPKYENYDAIEVNKPSDIPCDYWGKMGVYDSFLDYYNPDQFEIIGLAESSLGVSIGFSANLSQEQIKAIKKENPSFRRGNPIFRTKEGVLKKPFSRIIIRRKEQK